MINGIEKWLCLSWDNLCIVSMICVPLSFTSRSSSSSRLFAFEPLGTSFLLQDRNKLDTIEYSKSFTTTKNRIHMPSQIWFEYIVRYNKLFRFRSQTMIRAIDRTVSKLGIGVNLKINKNEIRVLEISIYL